MWSHYSNLGPRTTNLVEGFHNGMNSGFGMPHPSLRTCLHWLQKCQFEVQCRHIQLAAGHAPKPRSPTYVDVDERLQRLKLSYSTDIGHIFVSVFPQHHAWEMFHQRIRQTTYLHLRDNNNNYPIILISISSVTYGRLIQ